jgi:L-alanine-DL-glutamate epimerase-like enolase superfamily enzyme
VRIVSADARCYRLALPAPWGSASAPEPITHHELVVVRLSTDSGHEGVGWSYTVGRGGTAVQALLADDLLPPLLGRDPAPVGRIWHELWRRTRDAGGIGRLALAALDVALWDLWGAATGQPLYALLGGARVLLPAYASGVNLHLGIPDLLAQVERWQRRGYTAFKIKVGHEDPAWDLERVRAVRAQIGPRARLMLDANQKWTPAEAVRRVEQLQACDPWWIEEPVAAEDIAGNAWVRGRVRPPVALGENVCASGRFAEYLARGAVDIVQPDVARVGGITEWMTIAHLAQAFNHPVSAHLVIELSVHLHAAIPNAGLLEDVDDGNLTDLGVLREPVRAERGAFMPPSAPGHGVRFDWAALERSAVRPPAGAGDDRQAAPPREGGA